MRCCLHLKESNESRSMKLSWFLVVKLNEMVVVGVEGVERMDCVRSFHNPAVAEVVRCPALPIAIGDRHA